MYCGSLMLCIVRNPLSLSIGGDQPSLLHILVINASTVNKKAGDDGIVKALNDQECAENRTLMSVFNWKANQNLNNF